jgi:protein involved in polysaccharide export with SLBB domain
VAYYSVAAGSGDADYQGTLLMKEGYINRTVLLAMACLLAMDVTCWGQEHPVQLQPGQSQNPVEKPPQWWGKNPGSTGMPDPSLPKANAGTQDQSAAWEKAVESIKRTESPVAPGDLVVVQVKEDAGILNNVYRVNNKGKISLSYVGEVGVEGLTGDEVAGKLKEKLEADYLVKASVSVEVGREISPEALASVGVGGRAAALSMGMVYVMGKVRAPGPVNIPTADFTVSKAVLAAGVAEFAKISKTKVVRLKADGKSEEIIVNVYEIITNGKRELDIPVQKDDWIIVPQAVFPGPS